MCLNRFYLVSLVQSTSKLERKLDDTATSASSGQGKNQLMVTVEKMAGNLLALSLNLGPTGEKESTVCKLSLNSVDCVNPELEGRWVISLDTDFLGPVDL